MKIVMDLPEGLVPEDAAALREAVQQWAQRIIKARSTRIKTGVKYPNLRRAAAEMGYDFTYLWRVLEGKPGFKGRAGLVDEFWAVSAQIAAERKAKKSA